MQTNRTDMREWGLRALATVGVILLLLIGAWGVVVIARNLPSVFSQLGAAVSSVTSIFIPAERIEITMESANITSGVPFTFSWTHEGKRKDGSYTISYACRDGLTVEAPTPRGTYSKVPCNTPFNFENATESVRLIATSIRARYLDVPFTISFTRISDGKVTATSETTLTIVNEDLTSTPTTPSTPATPTTPSAKPTPKPGTPTRTVYTITPGGRISDPNGRPDLAARILALGVLDRSTNVFTAAGSVRPMERAAVRFEIENSGTKTAENWSFNVVLPTWPFFIFHSTTQPALGPGDKIEYTLGFDAIDTRATGGVITVNADPTNSLFEASEDNNIARATYTVLIQ